MPEKLWGGRFRQPIAAEFERFSESFSFDRRLALTEVRGSRVQAEGLLRSGVLSAEEAAALAKGFDQIESEVRAAGAEPAIQPAPPAVAGMEDVHTYVAQRLKAIAGDAADKLQTGRSRNEQVTLDLRLYLRAHRPALLGGLGRVLTALAQFAGRHAEVIIPGYTHLQRAQPVSLGHHALAYAEMLLRDAGRLQDAFERMDVCPLGSGALAGNPWKLDREAAARSLGFSQITQNSLDAVSDRDYAIELVFCLSLLGLHLSRWAEDWILYSSAEFGWLVMGDAYATGSSLMPQKKNPDALELIRGKSARPVGHLHQLMLLIKGLPLAYNRDLQEDKEPVFDAVDTALGCLEIAAGVIETTRVDEVRAAACSADAALLATDLADLLVAAGVPFHRAHQQVGAIISEGLEKGKDFRQFTAAELRALAPDLDPTAVAALSASASLARRNGVGGTAVEQVRRQAQRVERLAAELH